jgi:microcystin degradation protein MlrC
MKRIAFARIAQETNALSPVPTERADFAHYVEGAPLLDIGTTPEVAGFFKRAELAGFLTAARARRSEIEPVPLLSAWASSGGPLSRACFEALEARLVEMLRAAGPLDGMYFCLHGAMGVHGIPDPETRLIRAARSVIGDVPLVASHDLHGNLTRARVEACTAIVGYQTNPHRDHARTGKKAGELVIGSVLGELHLEVAWRSLPMILGGGTTIDFLAPMRKVFRKVRSVEREGRALSASAMMVHPWNADPGLGWATYAVTDGNRAEAERIADELAEMCWSRRLRQPPSFPDASEAIARARAARWRRKLGCVMMADASDVVTAGAPGDSTHLIRALLAEGAGMLTYAAVRDPDAVAELWPRAAGDRVTLSIGGKLDPEASPPLPVCGVVQAKHDRVGFGRSIVLSVDHLRIVIVEGPAMVMRPSFYKDVGLDPWRADIVVVKNFFPFLMYFLPYNRKTIFVRTSGRTDFDAAFVLGFDGPVHPRDPVPDWRVRDRQRRTGEITAPAAESSDPRLAATSHTDVPRFS